jgi:hypothetical protein
MPSPERWLAMWHALGGQPERQLYDQVVARYSEPHRHYHTARHLDECFAHFERVHRTPVGNVGEVLFNARRQLRVRIAYGANHAPAVRGILARELQAEAATRARDEDRAHDNTCAMATPS